MKEIYNNICKWMEEHHEEMIAFWRDLVNHKSYVGEPEDVNNTVEFVKEVFENEGFQCETFDVGPVGRSLKCVYGAERTGKPIIFSGHLDTVFPSDSFEDNPFRIEDGKAYGPGCLDMKGGVAIALFVCRAFNALGYDKNPFKILLSGNEENAHLNSTGHELFLNEAGGALFAFNMETGVVNGSVCSGRKGRLASEIEVIGREAHAGNNFEAGRNAIEEMAHKILAIQALTDLSVGTTANVGTVQGGTVVNAVAEKCVIGIDVRFTKYSEMDRIKAELEKIANDNHVPDVSSTLKIISVMPSYETNEDVDRFYNYVTDVAGQYGLGVPGQVYLGGSSDASWIQRTGTPVLCSFGVCGEWNHTKREYAVVSSMLQRAKLISACILEQDKFA